MAAFGRGGVRGGQRGRGSVSPSSTGLPKSDDNEMWPNSAPKFARGLLKGEMARCHGKLSVDYDLLANGEAFYLRGWSCKETDLTLLQKLSQDLKNSGSSVVAWSKHLKLEGPEFSPTFNALIKKLSSYFDVEVYATRMNLYADGTAWKPFHHDSHAYHSAAGSKEDFTMGLSLGAQRALVFLHEPSGAQFSFPQKNGDVFAFNSRVNAAFMHGVPKLSAEAADVLPGPRISLIAWGRRRSFNERNSSAYERANCTPIVVAEPKPELLDTASAVHRPTYEEELPITSDDALDVAGLLKLVSTFVTRTAEEDRELAGASVASTHFAGHSTRVQGGWGRGARGRGAPAAASRGRGKLGAAPIFSQLS